MEQVTPQHEEMDLNGALNSSASAEL